MAVNDEYLMMSKVVQSIKLRRLLLPHYFEEQGSLLLLMSCINQSRLGPV